MKEKNNGYFLQLKLVEGNSLENINFELLEGTNLIGRWDPQCASFPEIDLDQYDKDALISRKHASIYFYQDRLYIEDLGSKNGTFVNEKEQVLPGEQRPLKENDNIKLGNLILVVKRKA